MSGSVRAVLFALCAFLPVAAAGQRFDAVVTGEEVIGACFILPISVDVLEWVNPDSYDDSTDIVSADSNDGQRVLGLTSAIPYQIFEIRPDGSRTLFYAAPSGRGFQLAVAANGDVYVHASDLARRLDRISPGGTLEASYPLPPPAPTGFLNTIDVAADGCTVFYADDTSIKRMNGCTGAALSDFATVASLQDFEVLSDGRVLVGSGGTVVLYDAAGAPVRTVATLTSYGFGSVDVAGQVALRNGVVWIAVMNICEPDGTLLRVSFDSGAGLARDPLQMNAATGLVIGAGAAAVPSLTELALAVFAAMLAAAGLFALRR